MAPVPLTVLTVGGSRRSLRTGQDYRSSPDRKNILNEVLSEMTFVTNGKHVRLATFWQERTGEVLTGP